MAPQKFADLGKEAKDLVNKSFNFGVIKLEAKTKSQNGVEFTTEGSQNTDTGNVVASLETTFAAPYGINVTEKWNTDNTIETSVGVENKLLKGLKIDLDTTFSPVTGKKSAKIKTAYQHCDYVHGTADVDLADLTGPTVSGSAVVAYKGWHLGYQASYDTSNAELLENNTTLTYKDGDLILHSGIINLSKYTASIHHQVNKDLSAAALVNYDTSGSSTLTVSGKYVMDDDAFMKAKLDNNLVLGLAYAQKLRPGLQLTLSGLINAKSLDQGGHKLGLSLNFDA